MRGQGTAAWMAPAAVLVVPLLLVLSSLRLGRTWKGKRELILESSESLRRRPLAREVSEPPHQMRVEIAQSHDEGEYSSDELDEAPLGHHLSTRATSGAYTHVMAGG